jgi:hypothetical protein
VKKALIILAALALLLPLQAKSRQNDREYWCSLAWKMAQPVSFITATFA